MNLSIGQRVTKAFQSAKNLIRNGVDVAGEGVAVATGIVVDTTVDTAEVVRKDGLDVALNTASIGYGTLKSVKDAVGNSVNQVKDNDLVKEVGDDAGTAIKEAQELAKKATEFIGEKVKEASALVQKATAPKPATPPNAREQILAKQKEANRIINEQTEAELRALNNA
jgi:HSP90 family molecular chaperone